MTAQAQIQRLSYLADTLADLADKMPDDEAYGPREDVIAASHRVEDSIAKLKAKTAESVGDLMQTAAHSLGVVGPVEWEVMQ